MSSKNWLRIGIISAAAITALVILRSRRAGRLPAYDLWQRKLAERHGEWYARELIARIQARYSELYAARKQYANPVLRRHYEGHILPGIALYRTLQVEGWTLRAIQDEMAELLSAQLRPQTMGLRLISRLPDPFAGFRALIKLQMKMSYPAEGWQTQWEEDSSDRLAFTISRCFYLDVLSEYGVPELTPMFCETDDRLAEGFPPQVRWRRKSTLGKGAEGCDFCYERGEG